MSGGGGPRVRVWRDRRSGASDGGLSGHDHARGLADLDSPVRFSADRVRRAGGGHRPLAETDPTLLSDLKELVDDEARGDPESPLRWTAKSVRTQAAALRERGHQVSHETVAKQLRGLGYSLQANRKTKEGGSHPDRDAQFGHINTRVSAAPEAGEPVISVDTKKKELVGDSKNAGREWRPKGSPVPVRVHDFKDEALGKVNPYGVFDIAGNTGWVSVGSDADTAEFAVAAIRGWWEHLGAQRYPNTQSTSRNHEAGLPIAQEGA